MLMVNTIRNHQGIGQCKGKLVKGKKMCILGLLGFRAGISREDMKKKPDYREILSKYGINDVEREQTILVPPGLPIKKFYTNIEIWRMFTLNDAPNKFTFDQIADCLEYTADKL